MELMVDFITSFDGYGAAEGWPGFWGLEGPEYLDWLGEDSAIERTVLMGANTYRLMYDFAKENVGTVGTLNSVKKYVFSNSLPEPLEWENSILVRGDAIAKVRELKEMNTMRLTTLGSISLCRSLMEAGLVDRFRVVVFPVITGQTGSERIYDGYPDVLLKLTETRTFDSGLQLFDFTPQLLDAPLPPGPTNS